MSDQDISAEELAKMNAAGQMMQPILNEIHQLILSKLPQDYAYIFVTTPFKGPLSELPQPLNFLLCNTDPTEMISTLENTLTQLRNKAAQQATEN